MDKDAKQAYKESRSALRILLKHSALTSGVNQFKLLSFRGTDYIYNTLSNNVIATCRLGSKGLVVRYRPTSHYADILVRWPELASLKAKRHIMPSHNLSRMQRRAQRWSLGVVSYDLREITHVLIEAMGKEHMYNNLIKLYITSPKVTLSTASTPSISTELEISTLNRILDFRTGAMQIAEDLPNDFRRRYYEISNGIISGDNFAQQTTQGQSSPSETQSSQESADRPLNNGRGSTRRSTDITSF